MALAKFGAVVTDVRGKLGGHVFQGNRFATSVRTGYSGKGGLKFRNNVFQPLNDAIDQQWLALSMAAKSQWNVLARQYPVIGQFGDQNYLTGQNLYRRNYTAFYASGQTGVIDPYVAIGDLPSSNLEHVEFDFSNQEIDVQFRFDRFSKAIIVYGRPVAQFGLAIDPHKLPFVYGEDDETPQDDLLWQAWFSKYPDFQNGAPAQFGIVQVNEYGFKSFVKTVYATFAP